MGRLISVRIGRPFAANGPVSHGREINAANTGLQYAGVSQASLTSVGSGTIASNGALIDRELFNGRVDVTGSNNTFRNCMWVGGALNEFAALVTGSGNTFDGCLIMPAPGVSWYIGINIGDGVQNTVITRCDLSGGKTQVTNYGDNTHLLYSYCHDTSLLSDPTNHPDNIEWYGGNGGLIQYCNLPMGPIQYDGSINIAPFDDPGAPASGLVRSVIGLDIFDNAIDGGQGHLLVDNQSTNGGVVHNVRVLRNDFGGHTNPDTNMSFGRYHLLTNEDARPIVNSQAELDANPDALLIPSSGSDANYWRGCSDLVPDRTGQIALAA